MTPRPPLVSVCVPVFNRRELVGEAISSALAQHHPHLEILVQDNASDDGTAEVLAALAARDPRVVVARNETTVPMAANWNRVIARARGELVAVLSSDDLLEPGFLAACLPALEDGGLDAVTTNFYWLQEGRKLERGFKVPGGVYRGRLATMLLKNPFNINVTLFRRALLERLRLHGRVFREPYISCDYDLWMRIAAAGGRIAYLEHVHGGCYRVHPENISRAHSTIYRHMNLTILANRAALQRQCPWAYRYKLGRILTHDLRDRLRGRPIDRRLNRAVRLALRASWGR
jgi:glycosyltransferase involved in cell wall biosynthesis